MEVDIWFLQEKHCHLSQSGNPLAVDSADCCLPTLSVRKVNANISMPHATPGKNA